MDAPTLLAAVFVLCGFCSLAVGQATPNLLRNGDFTATANGRPEAWAASGDAATVTQQLTLVHETGQPPFARLTCTRLDPRTASSHAMLTQSPVLIQKGRTYEFSAEVRADNIGSGVIAVAISNTANWSNCGLSADIPVSAAWTPVRKVFTATQTTTDRSRLQIWYTEPGTLEIRNVRLMEFTPRPASFTDVVPAGDSHNLLRNGSLESGAVYWTSLGKDTGWGNLAFLHGVIEQGDAVSGRSFLRIPLGPGKTPELLFDYYEPVARREPAPLAASLGWIAVEPGKPYTLSCSMRASTEGTPAVLGIVHEDPAGSARRQQKEFKLTTAWQRYSFTFRPQSRYAFVTAGANLSAEPAQPSQVDLDAVQLEQGDKATEYVAHSEVELALAPAAKAGIFHADEPAEVILHLTNATAAPRDLSIQLEARDFFDAKHTFPAVRLSIPASTSAAHRLTLPADWRGFYELTARADDAVASVRLAIVSKRTARETVCGINHAFASGDLIPLADRAGVGSYRDWSLKWQHIQPQPGQWRWDVSDPQIDRIVQQNLHILPLLPPFPAADWNSEAPASLPTSGYPGIRLRQAWAPRDPEQLASFITAAVNRYRDRVHTWEFLNEPIFTDYALPSDNAHRYEGPDYTPADYVKLLSVASRAMKSADPNCQVIGGIGSGPLHLTKEVIEAGVLQHIDLFNLHIYPGLRAPESFIPEMKQLLDLMDKHGGRKPIWITEFSYYGADRLSRDPFIPISWAWAENRLLADERQCADYTTRFFLVMLSHGVERIYIHSGASGSANHPNLECALFDYGGAPRKLVPAMATLTSLLGPAPRPADFRRIGAETYAAAFETGDQSLVALWSTRDTPIRLPVGEGVRYLDATGRALVAPPQSLSPSPLYLLAPHGQAKTLIAGIPVP